MNIKRAYKFRFYPTPEQELAAGLAVTVCGEYVSRAKPKTERWKAKRAASVKQEPTEATGAGVVARTSAVGIPVL